MSYKDQLLANMRAARAELEAAVAGERLDSDRGDGWRLRDVLAHIALWERIAARKIAGTPLPDGEDLLAGPWDLDAFNETMRERRRGWSDEQVLGEFDAAHRAIVAAVEAADDAACAPGGSAWTAVDEDGAGHYLDHFSVADVLGAERGRLRS